MWVKILVKCMAVGNKTTHMEGKRLRAGPQRLNTNMDTLELEFETSAPLKKHWLLLPENFLGSG